MISPFLAHLRRLGIEVSADNGKLRYKAPKGVLTEPLLQEMSERKEELLCSLRLERELTLEPPLSPRARRGAPIPLSFAQQRLWFLDQLAPGNPSYNMPAVLRLTGDVDEDALAWSLNQIIKRHDILRTRFPALNGEPVQIIERQLEIDISTHDLSALPPAERARALREMIYSFTHEPFALDRLPLMRARLIRLGERERRLVVVMHHIISDGWSVGILMSEMSRAYRSKVEGKPLSLGEVGLQYADYALWQREGVRGEAFDKQVEYWKERLGGQLAVTEIESEQGRPMVREYKGRRISKLLSVNLSEGLKRLARGEAATMYMVMVAGLKALLSRYCGQEDVVIGTAVSNRVRKEFEGVIGMFVNTVVMRTDLGGNPTFREVIRRVKEEGIKAMANQDVPFERVVEEVVKGRDVRRNPIFGVMFVMQDWGKRVERMGAATGELIDVESRTSKFDLLVEVEAREQEMRVSVEYDVDLYDEWKMKQVMGHYEKVLEEMVRDAGQRLWDFPLMTEQELRRARVDWNDTKVSYEHETCVHHLLEAQAARTPDAVAVVFNGEGLTYRELNERANQLAHHLRRLGVGPGVLVGICLDRSVEMIIALVAALKAGGAYLPIDAEYPKERLAFMLKDAQAPVLLTSRKNSHRLPGHNAHTILLDRDWDLIARESRDNPTGEVFPDNLTYIIYTSGSTGRPKGIGLPHRALTNLIEWHGATLSRRARVLQFASLSFDASFHEMFAAWAFGGTLFLIPEELRMDVSELSLFISRNKMTKIILPVVVLQQMAEEYRYQKKDFSSLTEVITTGEQLQITKAIIKMFEELNWCSLHNHYGPSESHVVTYSALASDPEAWPTHPPIGRPIFNTQIYILDERLNPVPPGVRGGLYIGGVSLARGYMGRPDLTAEKFIPDLFSEEPGQRLYKTGDVARYLPGGEIQFLGRLDHQVKIRGFRVEPGEVEAALAQHAAVQEAVVVAREDSPGNRRLVAYVVSDRERKPATAELRSYLRERLPDYLIPSAFVVMKALPLTPNGKIDHAALMAPYESSHDQEFDKVSPGTPAEEYVARLWGSFLEAEHVGIHDNFFDAGGHSLLAMQIVLRLREAFQIDLPLRVFFDRPDVDGLVNALAQLCGGREALEEAARRLLQAEQLSDCGAASVVAKHKGV
ncbi:MAG TPA: amino acid adenylation domain-containing protein [Blastocatellia bacterium]|nr:amino acid adenylation domain-containing protein [Blastocatellia bacterium]